LRSNSAIDTTNAAAAQDPYTGMSYKLVGNIACPTGSPTPTPTPTPTPSPTPTPTPSPGGSTIQFGSSSFAKTEACTFINISVVRSGANSGTVSVDYTTNDGTAQQHGDYEYAAGRLVFNPGETDKPITVLINEDGYVEGAALGPDSSTTLTINDNDSSTPNTNPIDDASTFVCQHYHDFLNRQSEPEGQQYWTNEITKCGNDQQCVRNRRVGVSGSFFVEDEFQDTGSFVYLIYKESFGRRLGYTEFMGDRNRLHAGTNLAADRLALAEEFVQRSEFVTKYPLSQSASEYVDALIASVNTSSGVNISSHRTELINEYNTGSSTQANRRARVLVKVVDFPEVVNAEYVRAFVLAEYFGYLRRNPNDAPDSDYTGYDFWLTKLNQFNGSYINAEMVKAFLSSIEYRQRFGP
jgi:hypothetical protein